MKAIASHTVGLLLISILIASAINAEESKFRKQFIESYRANNVQALSVIIRQNKDTISAEVDALINEAMSSEKNYLERMGILDIANAMAAMNIHWNNGDEKLLKRVETLQREEAQKEKKRTEELERVKEVEKVPGNFVMASRREEMAAKGLSPVIYPHWIHRSFFRCKVCHEKIFIMKRGANDISYGKIQEGKLCGTCHNGTISFSAVAEENCGRCHIFGKPEAKPLVDMSYYNHDKFKEIASRTGGKWNSENLTNGKLPLDRLGFINWIEMDNKKAFNPRDALDSDTDTSGIRETSIFFETSSTFMKGVLFSHKIHSTWVRCTLCHPNPFKPEVGQNKVKMIEMKDGKSCGKCHGKVAFTYADCLRCHNQTKENLSEGVLINHAEAAPPQAQ
ncbi:MAG: c(7)-type cytochrome triheme domain-containing protein [Deltaproteobacteria bacterium]